MNMNDMKRRHMKQIQTYAFAVTEAVLYLDTHPEDKAALSYFDKYRKLLRESTRQYEEHYGPITADGTDTSRGWAWVLEPWPWEPDAN